MGYRDDEEADRVRTEAVERAARLREEDAAREERDARDEQLRVERENALREALVELSKPQAPFVRREEPSPAEHWRRTIGILFLIGFAVLAAMVVGVALMTTPAGW